MDLGPNKSLGCVPGCGPKSGSQTGINIMVVKYLDFSQTAIKDISQQSESEKMSVNNQTVIEFVIIISICFSTVPLPIN